jgi:hypothetical protein
MIDKFKESNLRYTKIVLKHMCKIAKVDYDKVNFSKPDWYLKHTITEKDQNKFRDWMIKYLMTNKKAREEIMSIPIKEKKRIERTVNYFILNYGFKTI